MPIKTEGKKDFYINLYDATYHFDEINAGTGSSTTITGSIVYDISKPVITVSNYSSGAKYETNTIAAFTGSIDDASPVVFDMPSAIVHQS